MVKRRHLPCRNCSAWNCVKTPSRHQHARPTPGSGGSAEQTAQLVEVRASRFSSTTPLLRTNSRNSSFVVGDGIGFPFADAIQPCAAVNSKHVRPKWPARILLTIDRERMERKKSHPSGPRIRQGGTSPSDLEPLQSRETPIAQSATNGFVPKLSPTPLPNRRVCQAIGPIARG